MSVPKDSFCIAWVPCPASPLGRFGASWTGWCPDAGERRPRFPSPWAGVDVERLSRQTARIGFRGAIGTPFQMDYVSHNWSLQQAVLEVTDETPELRIEGFRIGIVAGQVSFVPRDPAPLDRLARRIAAAAAPFHHGAGRSAGADQVRAIANAAAFHLPLTDRIGVEQANWVARQLRPVLERFERTPHRVADLALIALPESRLPGRVIERFPLGASVSDGLACLGPRVLVAESETLLTA